MKIADPVLPLQLNAHPATLLTSLLGMIVLLFVHLPIGVTQLQILATLYVLTQTNLVTYLTIEYVRRATQIAKLA